MLKSLGDNFKALSHRFLLKCMETGIPFLHTNIGGCALHLSFAFFKIRNVYFDTENDFDFVESHSLSRNTDSLTKNQME